MFFDICVDCGVIIIIKAMNTQLPLIVTIVVFVLKMNNSGKKKGQLSVMGQSVETEIGYHIF